MVEIDAQQHKKIQSQLEIHYFLTFFYFCVIQLEVLITFSKQFSLFEFEFNLSPFTSPTSIDEICQRLNFMVFFIFLMITLITAFTHSISAISIILLKFIELIPILIDLINLLVIYQYKVSSNRLYFSLILILIRLIINFDIVRRKCDCQLKRQIVLILDLLLFILIHVSLLRNSNKNFIGIGQKIFLGLLIFRLKNLLGNENFWINFNRIYYPQNVHLSRDPFLQRDMMKMLHVTLSIRWYLSLFIICLYFLVTFNSIFIDENGNLVLISHMIISVEVFKNNLLICLIILCIIYWDTLQNKDTLNQNGVSCFSIGFDLVPNLRLNESSTSSQIKSTTTILEDNISVSEPIPKIQPTYVSPPDASEKSITTDISQNPITTSVSQNPITPSVSQNPITTEVSQNPITTDVSQNPPSTNKGGILHQFFAKLFSPTKQRASVVSKQNSLTIGQGIIEIQNGDITKQIVDVIIGSSSSKNLRQVLLKAAGDTVQSIYTKEYTNNPQSLIISTPPGHLSCKRIFFVKWDPDKDEDILRQSIIDLISNVVQNVRSHNFTSIAFPAIGCGGHACSVDVVVKTMVKEMKQHIQKRKLPWTVKFIIQPNQQNIYDEFCKQLLSSDHLSNDYQIPSTWQHSSKENQLRYVVSKNTNEYNSIINKFDQTMKTKYTTIIKLERIQNEQWYMQYMAHSKGFMKRLNEDTEKRLYHGCPAQAADLIIQECFNRSFAGVNGVVYGVGVYFSSNATYSHGYAKPNLSGERCMFVARVLVGKTTKGNSSMKTRPLEYDSTTDGNHIFVTYHDAQAYAEYLITYK